jgi:hypothetical protein
VKTPPLLHAGVLLITLVAFSALSAKAQTREISSFAPLRNRDVLTMVEKKYPATAIITMIKFSPCHFDTFPPILLDLKGRGVPGDVLQAMAEAPYGPSEISSSAEGSDAPIYHYFEQLKQMGLLNAVATGRRIAATRQSRARAARPRRY